MTSIVHKTVGGQTYYYLREMARVGGKPKMISQRYLGKASDIGVAMDKAMAVPAQTRHLGFGDVAAVWDVLDRLDVIGVIDSVVGARRSDAGASVGTYLVLAALNRVVACLLYTSDAADEEDSVDLGGRRIIKKKKKKK